MQVAGCRLKNQLTLHSTPVSLISIPVSLNQLRLLAVGLYIGVYQCMINGENVV